MRTSGRLTVKHINDRILFTSTLRSLIFLAALTGLTACASSPEPQATENTADANATDISSNSPGDAAATDAGATTSGDSQTAAATAAAVEPEQTQAPRIVETCKDEPYTKYEQQARDSIAKGLEATKAQKFGVGFRDVEEHNRWSKIHNTLFKQVNDACAALSECAKQHPKDKITECTDQAKTFGEWQGIAKDFAKKAKSAETTQPPKICSLTPDLADAARCFHGLADNIDKVCDSDACKETSDCWRGVGFLDAAISQARQSCGFVHEKLSNCRGFVEATSRREKKFDQCKELQGRLTVTIFPVL